MRTPEEIKKELECITCMDCGFDCQHCEVNVPFYTSAECCKDALEYIQQLEAKLLNANKKIKRQNKQLDHLSLAFARQTREVAEYKLAMLKKVEKVVGHLQKEG